MHVLIADDQTAVRSALRRVLHEIPNVTDVEEAANLSELFSFSYKHHPDLIFLDWELSGLPSSALSLPKTDPIRHRSEQIHNVVILNLHKLESHPRVIVLSTNPEAQDVSLSGGADAFVLKGASPIALENAIRKYINIPND